MRAEVRDPQISPARTQISKQSNRRQPPWPAEPQKDPKDVDRLSEQRRLARIRADEIC